MPACCTQKLADVGLIQNDVAGMAAHGAGAFAADGPMAELRALGSLFPEPIQVVATARLAAGHDRRPEGQAGRARPAGLRHPRQCRGVAGGQRRGAGDLGAINEVGLAAGLQAAGRGRGRRGDRHHRRTGPRPAGGGGAGRASSCCRSAGRSGPILAAGHPDLVPVTLPAEHLSGPDRRRWTRWRPRRSWSATAGLPDATVEALLQRGLWRHRFRRRPAVRRAR